MFLESTAKPKRQALCRTLLASGRYPRFGDEFMRGRKTQLRLATKGHLVVATISMSLYGDPERSAQLASSPCGRN